MSKFSKYLFLGIILSIVLGFMVGCKPKSESKVKITYWPSSNPDEIELAQVVVEEWNRKHPDVQVEMQPLPASQSSEEVLLAAVAAKTTPDVCSNIWPGVVPDFIEAGALIALDEFEDFSEVAGSRLPDDILPLFTSDDGHVYQIPWKGNPIMLEYNVRLFREAGIKKPPETYDEFFDAAKKLTKDRDGDGIIDQWMGIVNVSPVWWHRFFDFYAMYIAATGGKTLTSNGKVDFNNDYAIEVFRFFREGFQKGYFPRGTFPANQFLVENVAVQFVGPWDISFLDRNKPENFEYDFTPLPVPQKTTEYVMTYADPKNIVIFRTSKHPEDSWEFVKYLISKENDLKLLEICCQIPYRRDLDNDPLFKGYFDKNPKVLRFAKQISYTRGTDNISQLKEVFDVIAQAFDYCCLHGKQTPEEAISKAAETCQGILER